MSGGVSWWEGLTCSKSIEFEKAIQPLVEALCKRLQNRYDIYVITNDIYTKEDRLILTRAQALPAERILAVEPEVVLTPRFVLGAS